MLRVMNRVLVRKKEINGLEGGWVPSVDIYEKEDKLVVEIEVPGVAQDDITILVQSNRMEVRGRKREGISPGEIKYLRLEREYGKFRSIINLPCSVIPERAKATLDFGVLTIILKKHRRKETVDLLKVHKSEE